MAGPFEQRFARVGLESCGRINGRGLAHNKTVEGWQEARKMAPLLAKQRKYKRKFVFLPKNSCIAREVVIKYSLAAKGLCDNKSCRPSDMR